MALFAMTQMGLHALSVINSADKSKQPRAEKIRNKYGRKKREQKANL